MENWLKFRDQWDSIFIHFKPNELCKIMGVNKTLKKGIGISSCWKGFIPEKIHFFIKDLKLSPFLVSLVEAENISKNIPIPGKDSGFYGKWYYLYMIYNWFIHSDDLYWNLGDLVTGTIPISLLSRYSRIFLGKEHHLKFSHWHRMYRDIWWNLSKEGLSTQKIINMIYINVHSYNYRPEIERTIIIKKNKNDFKKYIISHIISSPQPLDFVLSCCIGDDTLDTLCVLGDNTFNKLIQALIKTLEVDEHSFTYLFWLLFGSTFNHSEMTNHGMFEELFK